ncbi:MAG: class I SAM-dependent methyltransferase [Anaerolineales bacterium]|nr:MAG: class I SAM-dependent methyltransferase [Anaerolineales bacterium]
MSKDLLGLHLRELPYFRALLRAVEASFYPDQDFPGPVLDVGCGDGHFTQVAFDQPVDIGIDPDLEIMREAQSRAVYRLLLQSDGARLPLPDASVGSAFSNSVLEHIPHLDQVLLEVGRVLKPGAPFLFTVPNPGYRAELSVPRFLGKLHLDQAAKAYESWFMRMSRTIHLDDEQGWARRLLPAGLRIERTFDYFSPASLHALEWGHYFGAPCLLPHWLFGRWIVAPYRWNLELTRRFVQPYFDVSPCEDGTYSYYLARRMV